MKVVIIEFCLCFDMNFCWFYLVFGEENGFENGIWELIFDCWVGFSVGIFFDYEKFFGN